MYYLSHITFWVILQYMKQTTEMIKDTQYFLKVPSQPLLFSVYIRELN